MSDAASGTMAYKYDSWGRIIEEKRTVDSVPYTTTFAWDGASRLTAITYPTGEIATQGYSGRGLPYSLGSSISGTIVSGMQYNSLGLPTQVDLGNNTRTTYGYWDIGGTYDNPGNYFAKLWKIKTVKDPGGSPTALQEVKHTWDAAGNLSVRENVKDSETESFGYDFLDRLTSAGGPYTESYNYNQIGNMTSKNGVSYTYGSKPHAVTSVGTASYIYDANGNMTTRGAASLTWDAENRLTGVVGSATYVYDGSGFRVKKTEGGETILYVNEYYEKNLTTATVTLYYYLGNRMVAYKQGSSLAYIHQDHLTGSSVISDTSGAVVGRITYTPFGETRTISASWLPAQKFTGQRLDDVGLYYYGARYYDPALARFVSPDSFVSGKTAGNSIVPALQVNMALSIGALYKKAPSNPQSLNRYSYVLNNPLKYVDPNGQQEEEEEEEYTYDYGWQGTDESVSTTDNSISTNDNSTQISTVVDTTNTNTDVSTAATDNKTSALLTNQSEKPSMPQDVTPAVKELSTKQEKQAVTAENPGSAAGRFLQGIALMYIGEVLMGQAVGTAIAATVTFNLASSPLGYGLALTEGYIGAQAFAAGFNMFVGEQVISIPSFSWIGQARDFFRRYSPRY